MDAYKTSLTRTSPQDAKTVIPWTLYLPLAELGYESFAYLVANSSEPAVISTNESKRRHGNKAINRAKLALNKLTDLVNSDTMDKNALANATKCTHVGPREIVKKEDQQPRVHQILHTYDRLQQQ